MSRYRFTLADGRTVRVFRNERIDDYTSTAEVDDSPIFATGTNHVEAVHNLADKLELSRDHLMDLYCQAAYEDDV